MLTPHPATPDAVADGVRQVVENFGWTGPVGADLPRRGHRRIHDPYGGQRRQGLDRHGRACPVQRAPGRPAGDGGQRRGRGGRGGDGLRRGPGPQGHGHPPHVRHRHRQRPVRRRRPRPQHRAGSPGAARPRRGEARVQQGQGGRGPDAGSTGPSVSRSTSPTSRCSSRPSCSSSAAASAARPQKFLPHIEGIKAEIVPAQLQNNAGIVGAAMHAAKRVAGTAVAHTGGRSRAGRRLGRRIFRTAAVRPATSAPA